MHAWFPSLWQWRITEAFSQHRSRISLALTATNTLNSLAELLLFFCAKLDLDRFRILFQILDTLRPWDRDKVIATKS